MLPINPKEIPLTDLPCVAIAHVSKLPDATGIYFVLDGEGTPLYIGQTVSLRKRLASHPHKKTFLQIAGCRCAWVLVPYDVLTPLEIAMIDFLKPSMNKMKGGNTRPVTEAANYETITLRLPRDLLQVLRVQAQEIGRPLNTHIIHVLEYGLGLEKHPPIPNDYAQATDGVSAAS